MTNDSKLYVQLEPCHIVDITRIFEGYEHIALVTTVDSKQGIVVLQGTPDTKPEMLLIVSHLPFPAKILDNFVEE